MLAMQDFVKETKTVLLLAVFVRSSHPPKWDLSYDVVQFHNTEWLIYHRFYVWFGQKPNDSLLAEKKSLWRHGNAQLKYSLRVCNRIPNFEWYVLVFFLSKKNSVEMSQFIPWYRFDKWMNILSLIQILNGMIIAVRAINVDVVFFCWSWVILFEFSFRLIWACQLFFSISYSMDLARNISTIALIPEKNLFLYI